MTIHKEGRTLLAVLLVSLMLINFLLWYFSMDKLVLDLVIFGSAVLYLLILQFFRHPNIITPIDEKQVLAPADGKVVVIEKTIESEYFKDQRIQISIFMSPIDVHVNRSPVAGIVKFFQYHPGKYLVAWHPKSSTENERTTMALKLQSGLEILVRQIAGAMARRIKWYVKEGDILPQGGEFGFIKFGSRLDVFLPTNAEVKVAIGDKTTGGKTVLAELI